MCSTAPIATSRSADFPQGVVGRMALALDGGVDEFLLRLQQAVTEFGQFCSRTVPSRFMSPWNF